MSCQTLSALGRRLRVVVAVMITALVCAGVAACGGSGSSDANTLNVLTWDGYHDPAWLDAFTKDTEIKVNVISAGSGLEQRIKTEGTNSPADLLLSVDIARLQEQALFSGEYDGGDAIDCGGE